MIKQYFLVANKKLAAAMALAFLLVACASQVRAPEALQQGKNDHREYRYMQLDNGLKVLLISDKTTDVAAASVNVLAGSGNDPLHRQGLAHFLEHMLFLGTAKYPAADEYQKFISENAGQHNAYTAFDHTNYFFTIKPDALVPALDRFARFFIDPLLDEAYIEREQHAVHSEYQARLRDEGRRQLDVIKTIIDQSHPFAKFSIGSLETLSTEEQAIRPDLMEFYQRYYVANNMSLSVIAALSLDELEIEVRSRFSEVRHEPEFTRDVFPEDIFEEGALPRMVHIKPEKNLKELALIFPMPEIPLGNGANSQVVLGHLLGHEGVGSLHSYLMDKGFIESLSAGTAWQFKGGSAFSIRLGLTPLGMVQKEAVMEAVFEAIAVLKNQQVPEWVFEELAKINQLDFDYGEAKTPLSAVISAANNLQFYAPNAALRGDAYFSQFDRKEFNTLLQRLNINNVLIIVTGDNFEADQQSPYHFVPYRQQPLAKDLLKKLSDLAPIDAIRLAEKNPFLPEKLLLQTERKAGVPQLIQETASSELWYKPLDRFVLPRATSYYSVIQPSIYTDKRQAVLLDVYAALLSDHLTAVVYPASVAGLNFSIYPHLRGLTLRIEGFSDKQAVLLAAIVDGFKKAEFSQEQFDRISYQLITRWQNVEQNAPYQRAGGMVSNALLEHGVEVEQKIQLLKTLKLADIAEFSAEFTKDARVRSLNSGNLSREDALAMQDIFRSWLSEGSVKAMPLVVRGIKGSYQRVITTPHTDALYALYWQGQGNSAADQVQWMLLGQTLESGFFHHMRTEKQLGYIVFAQYSPQFTVPGLFLVIQSPVAKADQLHSLVNEWRSQQLTALTTMSDADFARQKAAVMQSLVELSKTLDEESSQYWYELAMGFNQFDHKAQLQAALITLDKTQWISFVESLLEQKQPAQVVISTEASLWKGFARMTSAESIEVQKRYLHH